LARKLLLVKVGSNKMRVIILLKLMKNKMTSLFEAKVCFETDYFLFDVLKYFFVL